MSAEWLIPDYWLTGLGSWAVSYFLHSTVILGSILLLTHFAHRLSHSSKDVLIKIGLVAGILTASTQFVQSSNGTFVSALIFDIAPQQTSKAISKQPQAAVDIPRATAIREIDWLAERWSQINTLPGFLLAWLLGSSFFALRFIYLWQRFSRAIGQRVRLTHQPVLELCQRLKLNMSIKRSLKLTQSNQIVSPMAIGLSEICIPEDLWHKVDEEQFTAIIAHELAHVARMDSSWLFFWHLMSIVFFFQPLNKLTQLSFQSRAEFLADAMAVRQTKDPVAMVNSLMNAAKLARLNSLQSMAVHLLGRNATIVERAKSLLDENPMKTQTSLSFIALSAIAIVTVAALGLPSISLASKQLPTVDFGQQTLTVDHSDLWQLSTDASLPFETTIDHHEAIAGLSVEIHTKDVTFTDSLDSIAKIAPGGDLRFVSRSIYQSKTLLIKADDSGELKYSFKEGDEWVTDQWAAEQFIGELLDITMGRSDEFKRNRLKAYTNARPKKVQTDAFMVTTELLIRALRNESGIYSEEDLLIVTAMFKSPGFFHRGEVKWSVDEIENNSPFTVTVVKHGLNDAVVNRFGHLNIRTTSEDTLVQSSQYYLNNKAYYELFLAATEQPYVAGETEKAMVRFLVRLHFNTPEGVLLWLEEE